MKDSSNRAATRNENPKVVDPPGVTPGGLLRIVRALRNPVWRPLLVRTASVAAGMVGLAGIGMFSTLSEIEAGVGVSQLHEASTWLAGGLQLPAAGDPTTPVPATAAAAHPIDSEVQPPHPTDEQTLGRGAAQAHPPSENTTGNQAQTEQTPPGITPDGKVVLNTANAEQLQRLPGVGEKRAQKILELRKRLKRFRRASDLLRVRGIGVKSLRKMLPHLVVDPPPQPAADAGSPKPD